MPEEIKEAKPLAVGERVRCISVEDPITSIDAHLVGTDGVVVGVEKHYVAVAFDTFTEGHACGGLCENGKGWFMLTSELERIDNG